MATETLYRIEDGETKALIMIAPMSTLQLVFSLAKPAVTRIEQEQHISAFPPASTCYFNHRGPSWLRSGFVWISRV